MQRLPMLPKLPSHLSFSTRGLTHLSSLSEALKASSSLLKTRVQLQGWVDSKRVLGRDLAFLQLRDGLGPPQQRLQVVVNHPELIRSVTYHCAVRVRGVLEVSPRSDEQSVEIVADHVQVLGPNVNKEDVDENKSDDIDKNIDKLDGYPFKPGKKRLDLDLCRRFPMYRAKLRSFQSLLRAKNALKHAMHEYLQKENFAQVDVPVLTSIGNFEHGQEDRGLFSVVSKPIRNEDDVETSYFDKKIHLSSSGQLHLEALSNGLNRVYNFNYAFRAENSNTRTHLAEFSMLEAEVAFCDDQQMLIDLIEGLIKFSVAKMVERCGDEFDFLVGAKRKELVLNLINKPFQVMTYKEALRALENRDKNKHKFFHEAQEDCDFGREHEIFLALHVCEGSPVFITEWPRHLKPFYAARSQKNADCVAALDLLLPHVGEVCGGSLRETNYDILSARLSNSSLQWYAEMRRRGAAPMGGFGLGVERLTQMVLDVAHIKDTMPFPRTPHNCIL